MHGNVWEWVEDCERHGYAQTPTDGSPWIYDRCGRRTVRGGSWADFSHFLRAAWRDGYFSSDRNRYVGFRVARTMVPD